MNKKGAVGLLALLKNKYVVLALVFVALFLLWDYIGLATIYPITEDISVVGSASVYSYGRTSTEPRILDGSELCPRYSRLGTFYDRCPLKPTTFTKLTTACPNKRIKNIGSASLTFDFYDYSCIYKSGDRCDIYVEFYSKDELGNYKLAGDSIWTGTAYSKNRIVNLNIDSLNKVAKNKKCFDIYVADFVITRYDSGFTKLLAKKVNMNYEGVECESNIDCTIDEFCNLETFECELPFVEPEPEPSTIDKINLWFNNFFSWLLGLFGI